MRKATLVLVSIFFASVCIAQLKYDSLTLSKCSIKEKWYGARWADTLKAGRFEKYISDQKTVSKELIGSLASLLNKIKSNGTGDISKCFIPRHSINFYKGGKIVRFFLVCFECDGFRFSDDTDKTIFVRSTSGREKQMEQLKLYFASLL